MKLRFHDDLRKLSRLPTSFGDLCSVVSTLFGPQDFVYRYLDEEGDLVTMASDQELVMACDTAQGPSLKIFLTLPGEGLPDHTSMSSISSVRSFPPTEETKQEPIPTPPQPRAVPSQSTAPAQPEAASFPRCPLGGLFGKVGKHLMKRFACRGRKMGKKAMVAGLVQSEVYAALGVPPPTTHFHVKCDQCGMVPIVGVRYKCTVCPNFDLCETCESQGQHPHPLLKVPTPSADMPFVRCCMPTQPTGKPRMDFVRHETYPEAAQVATGSVIEKIWRVSNPGPHAWPADTKLVMLKGNLICETQSIDPIEVGTEGLIHATVTVQETAGAYKGIFRLMTAEGKKFGEKLRVTLQATEPESVDQLVEAIKAMGFDDEGHIRRLLEQYHGDANEVITALFSLY